MNSIEMEVETEPPSKCLTFLCVSWKLCKCIFSHVTLVSLVVAYCVLGAYAFERLESAHEKEVKRSIKGVRGNVTDSLWSMTQTAEILIRENWTSDVVEKLKGFEKDLLRKMKKEGWDGHEEEDNIQWTFAGALFYSIIIITTIGYGHIVPRTPNGKVVTIFYAILGIPLMLLCLSSLGDVMASSFRFLYWKICCYICTRPPKPRRVRSGTMTRSYSVRQGSGRVGSTRAASFRRSVRTSQRSADSALGLSETMTRSTHSDTGYRYQPPRNYHAGGNGNDSAKRATLPSTASPRNIQMTGPTRHTYDTPSTSTTPRISARAKVAAANVGTTQSLDRRLLVAPNDAEWMSVFCNRYAEVEPDYPRNAPREKPVLEYATLPRTGQSSAPRRCRSVDPELVTEESMYHQMSRPKKVGSAGARYTRSNSSYTPRPHKKEAPSPRIMSPMGFAVHRQVYPNEMEFDDYSMPADDQEIKPVPIWLCVFLVVSYILGGAVLFTEWESWMFLDSAYFCFITLTTIGFGDFVPGHRLNAHQGIAICSLYLLFGIALLAMSFNLVQEEVITNVKSVAKRLGIIKEEDNDDQDEDDDMRGEIREYMDENYDCEYEEYPEERGYYNDERDLTTT